MTPDFVKYRQIVPKQGKKKAQTATIFGDELTTYQIELMLNIPYGYLAKRVKTTGCSLEDAIEDAINEKNMKVLGKRYPREYRIFYCIKTRTTNKKDLSYEHYGDKGIDLCDKWRNRHGFVHFIRHIGPMPEYVKENGRSKYSVDRINNSKGYEPGNVRWATNKEQARNRSDNHFVNVNGKRMVLSDAVKLSGLGKTTVWQRLKYGWSLEDALNTPVGTIQNYKKKEA